MRVQIDFGALFLALLGLAVLVAALGMGGRAGAVVAFICGAFILWALVCAFRAEGPPSG